MSEHEDLAATEARLRDAIGARAGSVAGSGGDDGLGSIKGRVAMATARDRRRRQALVVLGVAAAIVIVAGSLALLRGNGKTNKLQTTSTDATSTTGTTSTTVPGTTTVVTTPVPQPDNGIWPLASAASQSFDSPDAATFSFVTEYLHMSADLVQVGAPDGDTTETKVDVRPFPTGGPTTTVTLEQTGRGWVVLSSATPDIKVTTPSEGAPADDPLTVAGQSTAFEAVINLELRPQDTGERIGDVAATMGGSNGELGPFSTTLHPPKDQGPLVLLVYESDASGQGAISAATVVRLGAPGTGGSAAPAPEPTTYVALSKANDLTLLDFDGHVQQPLASGVQANAGVLDYNPSLGLVAAEVASGSSCSHDLQFFATKGTPRTTIEGAGAPAFSPDGTKLAYLDCGSGIHVLDLKDNEDRTLGGPTADSVSALTWAGNESLVAVQQGNGLVVVNPVSGATRDLSGAAQLIAGRGRFGTIAAFDGTDIVSINPSDGSRVKLVTPARGPVDLDADDSGAHLIWVDATGDVWTWSGGEPSQVASGMAAAAW